LSSSLLTASQPINFIFFFHPGYFIVGFLPLRSTYEILSVNSADGFHLREISPCCPKLCFFYQYWRINSFFFFQLPDRTLTVGFVPIFIGTNSTMPLLLRSSFFLRNIRLPAAPIFSFFSDESDSIVSRPVIIWLFQFYELFLIFILYSSLFYLFFYLPKFFFFNCILNLFFL
jgi:hypothetical protein